MATAKGMCSERYDRVLCTRLPSLAYQERRGTVLKKGRGTTTRCSLRQTSKTCRMHINSSAR